MVDSLQKVGHPLSCFSLGNEIIINSKIWGTPKITNPSLALGHPRTFIPWSLHMGQKNWLGLVASKNILIRQANNLYSTTLHPKNGPSCSRLYLNPFT
jgi:hypothetical protein